MAKEWQMSKITFHHASSLPKGTKVPSQHIPSEESGNEVENNHRLNGAADIHYAVKNKTVIGHVAQDDEGRVKGVHVDPEHRRQGVAEGLYHHIADTTGSIKSDEPIAMEPSAKAMWQKMKTKTHHP